MVMMHQGGFSPYYACDTRIKIVDENEIYSAWILFEINLCLKTIESKFWEFRFLEIKFIVYMFSLVVDDSNLQGLKMHKL